MHVFLVVALTAKKASPVQNPDIFFVKAHSTPRDTRHTPHTHVAHEAQQQQYGNIGVIFTEIEKDLPKKGLELSTTLGCPRKSHCSSSVIVPVAACICVSHISRDPQLDRSQGPI